MAVADYNMFARNAADFNIFAKDNHFQPSLVAFLRDNELADTYILKHLTEDHISKLNLTIGQEIALRKGVEALNRSLEELSLQYEFQVQIIKLKMEHNQKMAQMYLDYNKEILTMDKDVKEKLASINAGLIKSAESTTTITTESSGKRIAWGLYQGKGSSNTRTVKNTGAACITSGHNVLSGQMRDLQSITSSALVNVNANEGQLAITGLP